MDNVLTLTLRSDGQCKCKGHFAPEIIIWCVDFSIKIDCSREYLVNHIPNQEPAFRSRFHQTLVAQRQVRWLEHISTSAEVRKKKTMPIPWMRLSQREFQARHVFCFLLVKMSYDPWLTAVVQWVGFIPSFTNTWFVVLVEFRQPCNCLPFVRWNVVSWSCRYNVYHGGKHPAPFSSLTIVTLESGSNSIGTKKWHFIYTDLLTFGEIFASCFPISGWRAVPNSMKKYSH